jgi:hypothetical protein
MQITNNKIEELAHEYRDILAKKEAAAGSLSQVRGRIAELEEAEITGNGDPKALAAAKKERGDLKDTVAAADRVLNRLKSQISGAIAVELENQAKSLPALEKKVAELRRAAAREVGQALAVLQFLQSPAGVFGPAELVALNVGPLAGRKSEPQYYQEVMAELEKTAAAVTEDLPENLVQLGEFRELSTKIRFLTAWQEPVPQTARTPAEWEPGKIRRILDRQAHLDNLTAQVVATK